MNSRDKIELIDISNEMKTSFLDYAMSVIVSRALPDVRDGLKPVHRRILYAMNDLGMHSDKSYSKSARLVGEVIGKYHPHGDTAVYESMVRMAQDFSFRYMLVDGQGNFGSIDGDSAAAMRYTEAKMSKIAMELLRDINKDTVDFQDNYDAKEREPVVLPARIPNLLLNGTTGIAVGMATNMAPHNINEVIDGVVALIEDSELTPIDIMDNYISGPDFPTGAFILGRSGIRKAYETGNGSVMMRARTEIKELDNGKKKIIVTEIPYMVNKSRLIEKIAELVKEKRIDGITDLRDESSREGMSIIIELRRDVNAEVLLNQLFKLTPLQTSFGINALSLVGGIPRILNIKEILTYYIDHQEIVVVRKTKHELKKTKERAHILEGLKIALDFIDEIIKIIRAADTDAKAQEELIEKYKLSEIQAKAILEMRLKRLTGLERDKIISELEELLKQIDALQAILDDRNMVLDIIKVDLLTIKAKFGDERRSEIVAASFDLEDEDLIPEEEILISLTTNGYVKRLATDTYRSQNRGGRGIKGMETNDNDIVDQLVISSTHDYLLFFSNYGKVYRLKGYHIPEFSRTSKGLPIVNLLSLDKDEKILDILNIKNDSIFQYAFFTTRNGIVKRVHLDEFVSIRQSGKIAISLREEDELVNVKLTTGEQEIIIANSNGKAIRFHENQIRAMGRTATGVKGMTIDDGHVIGMTTDLEGEYILVITENGFGKMSILEEYRLSNRGGKGVKTVSTTSKNGQLVTIKSVSGTEDIIIMTTSGITIRLPLEQVSISGRATQGVRLIKLSDNQVVANVTTVAKIQESPSEDDTEVDESVIVPTTDTTDITDLSDEVVEIVEETEEIQE